METYFSVVFAFVFFAIIVAAVVYSGSGKRIETAREKAWRVYQEYLSYYRNDPTNPTLREYALQAGRSYSNVCRNKQGVTLFDEMALKNDLDAAGAGATVAVDPKPKPSSRPIDERLAELASLRERNLITDEEHARRREQLLQEI